VHAILSGLLGTLHMSELLHWAFFRKKNQSEQGHHAAKY